MRRIVRIVLSLALFVAFVQAAYAATEVKMVGDARIWANPFSHLNYTGWNLKGTQTFDPMTIWEKHLHTLIPSAEGTGSYYREQALWMKALSEVNRAAYDKLLANWQVVYRRRRNLWAEMKALKLPGL